MIAREAGVRFSCVRASHLVFSLLLLFPAGGRAVAADKIAGMKTEEARAWWAFQPLAVFPSHPAGPAGIDSFIDARLAQAGLQASARAGKFTLIRRVTYDLTGLPPTMEEVETFAKDESAEAFSTLVDRLLASPAYGEKWGRHWLDVVRYADSLDERGYDREGDILDAWRYRDWVVSAFNNDLPYNEFIRHQIAGDILSAKAWDPQKTTATAVYAIGHWGNGDSDKRKVYTDMVDDQIDLTGRAFLGLTIACARCHDHKFDPITTRDYYSLAGIFFSSRILEKFASPAEGERLMRIPLLSPEEMAARAKLQEELTGIEARLAAGLQVLTEVKVNLFDKPGLTAWTPPGVGEPSAVINFVETDTSFLTIKLPPRSVAVHPAPQSPVTVVWRSPVKGLVSVGAMLADADPNGGDGVAWEVRAGGLRLAGGDVENGSASQYSVESVRVEEGTLVQFLILPRAGHAFDSTTVNLTIRAADATVWDLRETLLSGAAQGADNLWWICGGAGKELPGNGELKALQTRRVELQNQLAKVEFTQGLREGGIPATPYEGFHDAAIHVRGSYDKQMEVVPRAMPEILTPQQPVIAGGSGRLELAEWITGAQQALTARVMVNRVWQHHFGEGLVRTSNNFGKLGTPPTHPELLDWLAAEFIRSGWSVKHLHRVILQSAAWQRTATPVQPGKDPDNLLLAHQNRRRLTAEELRDSLLAASGSLDKTVGNKSVRDPATKRRALYLTTIRSDRTSYQSLFDGADPTSIVEKRTESTVAPQALFLMNHPLVLDQAGALAAGVQQQPAAERLTWLWRRVFQYDPGESEKVLAEKAGITASEDAGLWARFCQMLLSSNEFSYVD